MEDRRRAGSDVPRAAVIGCGAIGSVLDEGESGAVLTHAGAYQASPRVELAALCDRDAERLGACGEQRGVFALYGDYEQLFANERIDVASICTPVNLRLGAIRAAVAGGVRVILCEKPLAATLDEARTISELIFESPARLALNYLRRWDPGVREALALFRRGDLGRIQKGIATYGKGVANNGSHHLDLLIALFGLPASVQALGSIDDRSSQDDPTIDARLSFGIDGEALDIYLLALDHRHFTLFELDLIGTRGRLRMIDRGGRIEISTVAPDPLFAGYRGLRPSRELTTRLDRSMAWVVDHLIDLYEDDEQQPACGIDDGIAGLIVLDALRRSLDSGEPCALPPDGRTA